MLKLIKSNILLFVLILFTVLVLAVNLKINFFRYNNFDFGKFDLGNMTQMMWNTLHGRVLWLTDYFGTNAPRWAMSHVDPILLVFVPIFAVFQHPMTLVISQLILVLFSSILVYLIAYLELNSKLAAFFLGLAYLFYPAIGFLTAWTGFHGVTVVIPAFLGAFYVYERMYKKGQITRKGLIVFWILLVLTMMGKEQLPLYIAIYGVFIWLFRQNKRTGFAMMLVGFIWFFLAFFVIIPQFAHYRIEGYQKFAQSLQIDTTVTRDVEDPNYFLSRYEAFGNSYGEIAVNMALHPSQLTYVFFGGDKLENLQKTFEPVAFLPLAFPVLLVIAAPDFLINYLTTADNVGTSEIINHRISMVVPIIFISTIFAIGYLAGTSEYLKRFKPLKKLNKSFYILVLSFLVLGANIYTSFSFENPVYLWLTQAVDKRLLGSIAFAKTDSGTSNKTLKLGDVVKISPLDDKDRECAQKIVSTIPNNVSVSGPDYMGAHLSMRETYAIFPALYNQADYVIVDVFSKKILTILDLDLTLVRDVVGKLIKDPNYELTTGCGNLFVFKRVGPHGKTDLLPLQQRFVYSDKYNFPILQSLNLVDFTIPQELNRSKAANVKLVYKKTDETASLDSFVLFMTFINKKTGEMYQVANLPSYGIQELKDWSSDYYYIEDVELVLPESLDPGTYQAFIGMTNIIKTRSVYLGDISVK